MQLPTRLILFVLALSALAKAQATPTVEIFSGYSFAYANFTGSGQRHHNLAGWEASATINANRWLGMEADFAGHYGSSVVDLPLPPLTCPPNCLPGFSVDTKAHDFLFGPRFSHRISQGTTFAHVLFGATRVTESTTLQIPLPAPALNISTSQTGFAMALGGGFDVPFTHNLAWHNQADYLLTRLFNRTENNLRVSTGIVFRF